MQGYIDILLPAASLKGLSDQHTAALLALFESSEKSTDGKIPARYQRYKVKHSKIKVKDGLYQPNVTIKDGQITGLDCITLLRKTA